MSFHLLSEQAKAISHRIAASGYAAMDGSSGVELTDGINLVEVDGDAFLAAGENLSRIQAINNGVAAAPNEILRTWAQEIGVPTYRGAIQRRHLELQSDVLLASGILLRAF